SGPHGRSQQGLQFRPYPDRFSPGAGPGGKALADPHHVRDEHAGQEDRNRRGRRRGVQWAHRRGGGSRALWGVRSREADRGTGFAHRRRRQDHHRRNLAGQGRRRQHAGSSTPVRPRGTGAQQSGSEAPLSRKPEFYRIYKFEQGADVARRTATGIDRVNKLSIKATGPRFAPLFNGSEQLISITSVPSYSRSIYIPVM